MFKSLINQLKKIEATGIAVPLETDADGYLDRECPSQRCLFQFKVHGEDWKNLCKDDAIHCPLCGHQAHSKSWFTQEQIEGAQQQAKAYLGAAIHNSLASGAQEFNRRQRSGLITMKMEVRGGRRHHTITPIQAQEAMQLKIQCEACTTRFAVIGSAFFCPCCGVNSVERMFDDSLKKVEAKLDNLETIRAALESSVGKDEAALTCRSLVESGLGDCVVGFRKLMESLYLRLPGTSKPPQNTFQRLNDGSALWKQAFNEDYSDWISAHDLAELNIFFQRRHSLSHNEGLIDEAYLKKSGDTSYSLGQRLVVRERDVRRLLEIIKTLALKARSVAADRVRSKA